MHHDHNLQVEAEHYFRKRYLHKQRWLNFWYQIEAITKTEAKSILEIGPGNGIVTDTLRKMGYHVDTLDIDPKLDPTFVGSVTNIPLQTDSYDLVLCAEVLEHLPFDESKKGMSEIQRVTRKHAVITLPHTGKGFAFIWKVPLIPWQNWGFKIPHFWETHAFNGQHYWEVGKNGTSRQFVQDAIERAGFHVIRSTMNVDDPAHILYFAEKKEASASQ